MPHPGLAHGADIGAFGGVDSRVALSAHLFAAVSETAAAGIDLLAIVGEELLGLAAEDRAAIVSLEDQIFGLDADGYLRAARHDEASLPAQGDAAVGFEVDLTGTLDL